MTDRQENYLSKVIPMERVIDMIKPGNRIFLSSGPATPVSTVNALLTSEKLNLQDLEIIQLITIFDSLMEKLDIATNRFRLKTFNVGESISKQVNEGNIDFIPANLIEIPAILQTGALGVDIAVIQTTPPDERGFMRLGIAVDVAAIVMKNAGIIIAEINPHVPVTYGETTLHVDQVDYLVESDEPLLERKNKPFNAVIDKIGWHISNLIPDESTVALHAGRIFDAVAKYLQTKKNLGILTHVISDWAIDLAKSGAISLDRNRFTGGQISTSYCYGSEELYRFVDRNPVFEFHPIAILANPFVIRRVHRLTSIMNVKKIDVTGEAVIFHSGDNLLSGYESKLNFAVGATFSKKGKAIVALRSTDQDGNSNIVISHDEKDASRVRSTLGVTRYVVTEFGVANLFGKSIRERLLAMIDIAHPDHREELLRQAKEKGYAYPDQIYLSQFAGNYPFELETRKLFKDGLEVKFRAIKASDEDMMRRLFYQFSDEAKYFRYFVKKSVMLHREMQKYVNTDYDKIISIVAIVEKGRTERIIAEARYAYDSHDDSYETAFIVDEQFQGQGIGTFLLNYLIRIAQERHIRQLKAFILPQNKTMIRVFDKCCIAPESGFEDGIAVKRINLENNACRLPEDNDSLS
jgi:acyl-CoA hydrolase